MYPSLSVAPLMLLSRRRLSVGKPTQIEVVSRRICSQVDYLMCNDVASVTTSITAGRASVFDLFLTDYYRTYRLP